MLLTLRLRYVRYYEQVLAGVRHEGVRRKLAAIRLIGAPVSGRFARLIVTLHQHGAVTLIAPYIVVLQATVPDGAVRSVQLSNLTVSSDLRLDLADDHGVTLCRLWIHPALEPAEASFVLRKEKTESEIDVVEKGALPAGFCVVLQFEDEDGGAAQPGAMGRDTAATKESKKAEPAYADLY